ncbi:MAG: alpha-ketoglutarate-dependent dioxygenase AlkB [Colwellia sp.]|nr:alpha-ketoglutarate-dependent dioxygenase AlkB [Colwellia sp.]
MASTRATVLKTTQIVNNPIFNDIGLYEYVCMQFGQQEHHWETELYETISNEEYFSFPKQRVQFSLFNKQCTMKRDQLFFSTQDNLDGVGSQRFSDCDSPEGYQFNNISVTTHPFECIPDNIKNIVFELYTDLMPQMNIDQVPAGHHVVLSMMLQRYYDDDEILSHHDAEDDLNPDAPVIILSIGKTRIFRIRHKSLSQKAANRESHEFEFDEYRVPLKHGQVIYFGKKMNQTFKHSILKMDRGEKRDFEAKRLQDFQCRYSISIRQLILPN